MKRFLIPAALLLTLALALFVASRSMVSWRPQIIGAAPNTDEIQISPDGRWLLSARDTPPYSQPEFQLWDIAALKATHRLRATQVWWSADSRFLVTSQANEDPEDSTAHYQQNLRIVEAASGKTRREWKQLPFRAEEIVSDARLENNDRELLIATPFRVWRFDVKSGKVLSRIDLQIQYERDPQMSNPPNFQSFVDAGHKVFYSNVGNVFLLDAVTGARLKKLPIADFPILVPDGQTALEFNPDTGALRALDVSTGRLLWTQPTVTSNPLAAPDFSRDGKTLLTMNGAVRLLDARTGKPLKSFKAPFPLLGKYGEVPPYALAPDGNAVFFGERGKIIRQRLR